MKLVKKESVADGKIVATVTGYWDDGVCISNTTSWDIEYAEQVSQRLVVLQDFFKSHDELRELYKEHGYLDIRTDCFKAADTYLILKYGFGAQEVLSHDVEEDFWDEIYDLAPRSGDYYIHTVTSVSIRIDGEEYEVEWEPSEVRGIIADLFELES